MGRIALIAVVVSVLVAAPVAAATSGLQPYVASNAVQTYSTTSATFGTATASIQETAGQPAGTTWTYCSNHAVDGSSCSTASHVAAGTVSKWIDAGQTTLATLPNGARCYQHTDSAGTTWCYAGEAVQDNVGATGGPFGTGADTTIGELPGQGEAWWGSGGGPNNVYACEGMFNDAPSTQGSLSSCESQFGTVTWDTSGSMVASIRGVADEIAWRIGVWNGSATPGGVRCGGRTAIGNTASDSQAPSGLWMQWSPSPARGFWNCTAEDRAAGPPQTGWNGSSSYSRSYADWNGFGWYLVYYDYASFIEVPLVGPNGVQASVSCDGESSAPSVTTVVPSGVVLAIDESSGLATFSDQNGQVLAEQQCTNSASSGPPPTSPATTAPSPPVAGNYQLQVPVGQTQSVNVLAGSTYTGSPSIGIARNATQPGVLDSDPQSTGYGAFSWSPTYADTEVAQYTLCATGGCSTGSIQLVATSTAAPPTTSTSVPATTSTTTSTSVPAATSTTVGPSPAPTPPTDLAPT